MKKLLFLMMLLLSSVAFSQTGSGVLVDKKLKNPAINSNVPITTTSEKINMIGTLTSNAQDQLNAKPNIIDGVNPYTYVPRVYTSNVQHLHTGNTSATVVWTQTIPAGTVGPNGKIEVDCLWSCNNSVGTKTCAIKLGSSTLISTALAAHLAASYWAALRCRNSLTSQVSYSNGVLAQQGATVAALQNYTLDFNNDVVLTAVITLQTGTDNAALETITVKTWY
jgi:hypothetical protein